MKKQKPVPTPEQITALNTFRAAAGREWKDKLITAWMRGAYPYLATSYSHLLQQVRNQFGPSWLMKF